MKSGKMRVYVLQCEQSKSLMATYIMIKRVSGYVGMFCKENLNGFDKGRIGWQKKEKRMRQAGI